MYDLKSRHPRSRFAPLLHVGLPGRPERSRTVAEAGLSDHGLRASAVAALLEVLGEDDQATTPWTWLTRTGTTSWHDVDAEWLGPTLQAYSEAGLSPTFLVLTRHGWLDPRSGVGRTWKRLRIR